MNFQELGLISPILKALETEGYHTPTPIQAQAIPFILQKKDLLGCAQTGTGKTAAFALPIIQLLQAQPKLSGPAKIKTLILTPTRELAIQINESFKAYGVNTPLKHAVIFGGVGQHPQTEAIRRGLDLLIATPGRLLDLMNQGFISLSDIQIFVLDEADRMLDMGFIHDVRKVIAKLPKQRQTLFFSATMPPEIQKLADTILHQPEMVAVAPVSSTAEKVTQTLYFVEKRDKKNLLTDLLQDASIKAALVFTRTKHGANKVVKDLLAARISAEAIHGNKSQSARQQALGNFKSGRTRVLVATDIAARGIDIDDLAYVVNYDLPNIPETYVHRIGRTGRAGASGLAVSFCDREERAFLRDIERLIGKKVPVIGEITPSAPSSQPDEDVRPPRPQRNQPRREQPRPPAQAERREQKPSHPQGNNERRQQTQPQQPAKPGQERQQSKGSWDRQPAVRAQVNNTAAPAQPREPNRDNNRNNNRPVNNKPNPNRGPQQQRNNTPGGKPFGQRTQQPLKKQPADSFSGKKMDWDDLDIDLKW